MSEKVLGIISLVRPVFAGVIKETLFFTPDRVIIARPKGGRTASSVGGFLGMLVGIVIGIPAILAIRMSVVESMIIGGVCGGGGAAVGAVIGAIIDKSGRKEKKERTLEELFKAENNWVILNSEITKVELKKLGKYGARFDITTSKKKHKWIYIGEEEKKEGKEIKLEDYENMLRPIFGDKLFIKK